MIYEPRPDEYEDDEFEGCGQCGNGDPDSIDDLCHGGQVPCMHGDYARLRCGICGK